MNKPSPKWKLRVMVVGWSFDFGHNVGALGRGLSKFMASSTKPKPSQPKRKAKPKRSRALSPEQIEMHRALSSLRQKISADSLRGTKKARP